jgi:hypothetical protein
MEKIREIGHLISVANSLIEIAQTKYNTSERPAARGAQDFKNAHKGWFAYFRIYGPEKPAFDGSWKPGDFEEVK